MIAMKKYLLQGLLPLLLTSCTGMEVNHSQPASINPNQRMAFFPFNNMTETPQADERAEAITIDLMRTKGLAHATAYPTAASKESLIPGVKEHIPQAKLLNWAREKQFDYAISGSVTEWNYKVGLDGEPAIGVNLEMINVRTGQVVWSAVGSKSGGSRIALSTVAQNLIGSMLESLTFQRV